MFFCFTSAMGQEFSTKGTDFWFGFMENYTGEDTAGLDQMKVYITSDNTTATGTVSVPLAGWSQNFTILPNSTFEVTIPTSLVMCLTTETVENMGVHVTSDNPVTVYELNYVPYTSDANIIIPTTSLGNKYRVTTYSASPASPTWTEVSVSELLVVGVYDSTVIIITPKCNTEGMHGANVPFSITLNQGEVYQVRAYNGSTYNLTGSLIEIDTTIADNCKTFAVFSGNKCAFVPVDTCCCDHLCEQMLPINKWGNDYITVPLKSHDFDIIRVVALQNNTNFSINGGVPFSLSAGSYHDALLNTPAYFHSNKPISVTQFGAGGGTDGHQDGDPTMILTTPLDQLIKSINFNIFTDSLISLYYMNVIARTSDVNFVMLDGFSLGLSFTTVAGNAQYSWAQISVNLGTHSLSCDSGLIASIYGFGWGEAWGFIAGTSLNDLENFYNIITPADTFKYYTFHDTVCMDTMLMFVAISNSSISNYSWNFGDGSPVVNGQTVSHIYSDPGSYTITYYFQTDFCGVDSILWNINVKNCTSYSMIDLNSYESSYFNIYPNPSNGRFRVTIYNPQGEKSELEILNVLGQEIYKANLENEILNEVDVSDILDGVYFVLIKSGKRNYYSKIIIQN
jgi:hypothetical protein